MTNQDLNRLLKSAPAPQHTEEYWEQFPGKVVAEARRQSCSAPSAPARPLAALGWMNALLGWKPALVAGGAVALVLLGFLIGRHPQSPFPDIDRQMVEARKCYQEIEALFPNQVTTIELDERGARLLLADSPGMPAASPVYVTVRGPSGFRRYITFSGQQIRVNGDLCDVLLDSHNNVLLIGRQWLWSSAQGESRGGSGYQFAARVMKGTS